MAQKFTERQFTVLPVGGVTDHSMLRMDRTTTQSIPNDANTTITYDTVTFEVDVLGRITPNTGTGIVTVNEAGIYRVTIGVQYVANATGTRSLTLIAGPNVSAAHVVDASATPSTPSASISSLVKLVATDTIFSRVKQISGGSLNAGGSGKTFLSVEWAGPSS